MRNPNPIDDDDDDIREGSVHGLDIPMNESLFADIGTDDMSGFADPDNDSGEFAINYDERHGGANSEPAEVFDIDATEPPTISTGLGGESESYAAEDDTESVGESASIDYVPAHNEYESSDEAAQLEYAAAHNADVEAAPDDYYEPQGEPVAEYATEANDSATAEVASEYVNEHTSYEAADEESGVQYAHEEVASVEIDAQHEPAYAYSDEAAEAEHSSYEVADEEQSAAGASDEIPSDLYAGSSQSESEIPSDLYAGSSYETPAAQDEYQPPKPEPEPEPEPVVRPIPSKPTGLLSKFTGKRDTTPKAAPEAAKEAASEPVGSGAGFDAASLDAIGSAKGFDAASLDSIGTGSSASKFDSASLDAIGTGGAAKFDSSSLDAIGTPAAEPPPPEREKPKGLLGGKFGQKSKGPDKPKLGGAIQPPSNDPMFDQKETGRFMVDKSEVLAAAEAQSLTTPEPEYSAPPSLNIEQPNFEPNLELVEPEVAAAYAEPNEVSSDSGSGSFFDNSSSDVLSQEATPEMPSDEIGRLLTDADNAYRLRQFKAAEPIFANALEKLDKDANDSDPLLPFCLDRMGDNFYQLKRHKEALPIYRRLLTLQTKISSEDRDMISTLYKIAQTSEALNLTSEADSMYKRAFRLGQQSLVPGDPLLAKVLEGYGTMLMRSEGAEPPQSSGSEPQETTASDRAADAVSGLSADDIAALNALNVKGDSEPSPIILSGGPTTPAPDATLGRSGSRTPLRESDERADKVRASNAGPTGTASGGLGVRLGIFVALIAGLLFFVFNIKSDLSDKQVVHSKNFQKKTYKTLDNAASFTIISEDQATKDAFGKHVNYDYINFDGGPADDIAIVSGQINPNNFIFLVPQGIKTADGSIFYESSAQEHTIILKMKELGAKAQAYYKSKGQYPDGKELEKLVSSISYKNPFGDAAASGNSIAWPAGVDPSQVFSKSKLDASLEGGASWEGEPAAKPGQLSAVSSSQKAEEGGQSASVFYIHARDRNGTLIPRADGKTLLLSFKNGIDTTPVASDTTSGSTAAAPVLRLSKSGAPVSSMAVILSYLPVIFFAILSLIFLSMANKGADPTKGFNLASIGMIWAPVMVVLTMAMKLAPPQFSMIAMIAAAIGFVGGLGYIAFKFFTTQTKKPKKSKIEASSM